MRTVLEVIEITKNDSDRWNKLLYSSFNASYHSSLTFHFAKQNAEQETKIFVFNDGKQDVAGAFYELKKSPYGLIKTADLQSGVLFKSEEDIRYIPEIIEHYSSWAIKNKASYIRFTPWFPQTLGGGGIKYSADINDLLISFKFHIIEEGRHTYWIDLLQNEDEMLLKIKKTNRQAIRKGVKSDIVTDVLENPDDMIIQDFWEQYKALALIQRFQYERRDTFYSVVYNMLRNKQAFLFVSKYRSEIVSIYLVSNLGVPAGIYASTNRNYKLIENCPSPGLIITWEIIKTFKKKGKNYYDMGFCPGPVPYPEHKAYNIWRFKHSFGGEHVQFMPTYGKVLQPIKGKLFEMIRYRQKLSE